MEKLSYSQLIALNRELGEALSTAPEYRIYLLSNSVVDQLRDVIEYRLRLERINARVTVGNYDNIVQDTLTAQGFDAAIIFWEAWNIVGGLHKKIELPVAGFEQNILARLRSDVAMVLNNLHSVPLVLFNRFSAAPFRRTISPTALDALCRQLNEHLDRVCPANVHLVELDAVYRELSMSASIDWRLFYSSSSLYTVAFYRAYVEYVLPLFMDVAGKARKALIFDCDNTLWHGILGEDGYDGIAMGGSQKYAIFEEVQQIALALQARGVLLGLCSKNNADEVEAVIESHPDMHVRNRHLAIKKVNWNNKVDNLREIASELNIGLDSLVFVDDSAFEIDFVNSQLPEVRTFLVPSSLASYPDGLRRVAACFYRATLSAEDARRTEQYQQNKLRKEEQAKFLSMEEYLRSLTLSIRVHCNSAGLLARMTQLAQRTNQFNLTTRRHTEAEMASMLAEPSASRLYAFEVSDRFGDYGVVGLAILQGGAMTMNVESLLMSCRVLGRHVEYAFFNWLVGELRSAGVTTLKASYRRTAKNAQVAEFYESLGFVVEGEADGIKNYSLLLAEYRPMDTQYISVSVI